MAEVECYFCPNCFAQYTTIAATQDAFRCKQCLVCPGCSITLRLVRDGTGMCKFLCEHCEWTSEVIGVKDTNPSAMIVSLLTHEHLLQNRDEMQKFVKSYREKGNDKIIKMQANSHKLHNSVRLLNVATQILQSVRDRDGIEFADLMKRDELKEKEFASPKWGCLPIPNVFTQKSIEYASLAALDHKLKTSDQYLFLLNEFYPKRLKLFTKLSFRCPFCRKFVIKPSAVPKSSAFDKRSIALNFIPRIFLCSDGLILRNPTVGEVDVLISLGQRSISTFLSAFDVLKERIHVVYFH